MKTIKEALELARKLVNNNHERRYPMTSMETDDFALILTQAEHLTTAFEIQRKNYLELYDAVMGEGCITSDVKDISAIARRHREVCEKVFQLAKSAFDEV